MLVIVGHLIIPTPTPTWSEVIGYHLLFGVDEPTVFFTGPRSAVAQQWFECIHPAEGRICQNDALTIMLNSWNKNI